MGLSLCLLTSPWAQHLHSKEANQLLFVFYSCLHCPPHTPRPPDCHAACTSQMCPHHHGRPIIGCDSGQVPKLLSRASSWRFCPALACATELSSGTEQSLKCPSARGFLPHGKVKTSMAAWALLWPWSHMGPGSTSWPAWFPARTCTPGELSFLLMSRAWVEFAQENRGHAIPSAYEES